MIQADIEIKCVQCHKDLKGQYFQIAMNNSSTLWYCNNPACPNYGLYQRGEVTPKGTNEIQK